MVDLKISTEKNLTKLTEHRELMNAIIQAGDVPLLVFGELADNVDIKLQNSFSIAFLFERNQAVWKNRIRIIHKELFRK